MPRIVKILIGVASEEILVILTPVVKLRPREGRCHSNLQDVGLHLPDQAPRLFDRRLCLPGQADDNVTMHEQTRFPGVLRKLPDLIGCDPFLDRLEYGIHSRLVACDEQAAVRLLHRLHRLKVERVCTGVAGPGD